MLFMCCGRKEDPSRSETDPTPYIDSCLIVRFLPCVLRRLPSSVCLVTITVSGTPSSSGENVPEELETLNKLLML